MLFSVLIAHYNNFEYFKQCYESLKNQTYKNFEIMLVDDCFTVNSLEKKQTNLKVNSKLKFFQNPETKELASPKKDV